MQTIRDNVWWILGTAFLLVLLLRFGNFIGSVWTGLGVAAIAGVALGISLLPSWKNWAVAAFVGWLAVTITAPLFWNSLSFTLQDALGTRRLDTETRVAETVGSRGAGASRMRYQACSEWEDRFVFSEIQPLRLEIAALLPADPQVQKKIAELKGKEELLKQGLVQCADGLRYAIPKTRLPTTRAWATLLFAALLLSGWGIYRSTKESRWTRWVGGPLLIIAVLYLIYLFFDAGLDKKVGERVERVWNASTKESPSPPSPVPPKEEKKTIAAKERRWREATWKEHNNPSTWQQPGFEPYFKRFRYRAGQKFGVPPLGDDICTIIFAESGMFRTASGRMPIVCDNTENIATATIDIEGWVGACRKGKEKCLIFD